MKGDKNGETLSASKIEGNGENGSALS